MLSCKTGLEEFEIIEKYAWVLIVKRKVDRSEGVSENTTRKHTNQKTLPRSLYKEIERESLHTHQTVEGQE